MISLPNGAIRQISDATPTTGAGGVPSLGDADNAGILYPLGARYSVPATRSARGLLVVTSAGALRENLHPDDSDVAATDVVVNVEADSGDLCLVYVKNVSGSTIARGSLCSAASGADPFSVIITPRGAGKDEATKVIGVTLFDLATDKCGWIAYRGKVKVLADDTTPVVLGQALTVGTGGAAGRAENVADIGDTSIGYALEAAAVDALGFVQLSCQA